MEDDADAKMILTAPHQRTGRDHQGVPVSRGWTPARSESLQPHTKRSSWPGSEPSSVEADVYVWCYTLHARKEEVLAKRLAGKSISEMACFVSNGM